MDSENMLIAEFLEPMPPMDWDNGPFVNGTQISPDGFWHRDTEQKLRLPWLPRHDFINNEKSSAVLLDFLLKQDRVVSIRQRDVEVSWAEYSGIKFVRAADRKTAIVKAMLAYIEESKK